MAGTLNKMLIIGNVGKDPVTRSFPDGGKVTSFSVATSQDWTDKAGQKQNRTEWHLINVMNDALAEVAGKYLRKGSKVYIEGQLETRKYTDKEGVNREVKEVVLRSFHSALVLLDAKPATPDTRPGTASAPGNHGPR